LKKNKCAIDWEAKENMKKTMVEIIQQFHVNKPTMDMPPTTIIDRNIS
jgi:hypothetical protein